MKKIRQIVKQHTKFYVNKDKKTITAVIESPESTLRDIALFIQVQYKIDIWHYENCSNLKKLSETVTCSPEDEWNEDYGKRLAFNKLYSRQFKSVMNNYLAKEQIRLANTDDLICRILGTQTDTEFIEDFEDFLKEVIEENTELRAKIKELEADDNEPLPTPMWLS